MSHEKPFVRFMSRFIPEPNSGCWLWEGSTNDQYGVFRTNRGPELAHRYSYRVYTGDDPGLYVVAHKCNNKLCVNPAHLEKTTKSSNTLYWYETRGTYPVQTRRTKETVISENERLRARVAALEKELSEKG